MKILKNAVLALVLINSMACLAQEDIFDSLQQVLMILNGDTQLYAQLQGELDEIEKEFDASAELRRRLQCCVSYKVNSLYENYERREQELLAIIADKDETIREWEERYDALKDEAGAEMEALATMVEVLTSELNAYRQAKVIQSDDAALFDLVIQVQDRYADMEEQRINFLSRLETLANTAYGHFEVEAIESTVFGEQICGTLFCPELDDQQQIVEEQVTEIVDPSDADAENALASYIANWDATVSE